MTSHPAARTHPRLFRMIETASRHVEEMFRLAGYVAAVWHYERANGDVVVCVSPPELDKDQATTFMRHVLAEERAVAVLYFDEAWSFTTMDPAEADKWLRNDLDASHHPRRVEIVHFQAEDDTGQCLGTRVIHRKPGRPPELGPLEIDEDWQPLGGRMSGMLPRTGTLQ